ncbi:uncharacterized protein METZ01_LOCUS404939, partial [marine metagenome]
MAAKKKLIKKEAVGNPTARARNELGPISDGSVEY